MGRTYKELQARYWQIKDIYADRLMLDFTEDPLVETLRQFLVNWDNRGGRLIPAYPRRLEDEAELLEGPANRLWKKMLSVLNARVQRQNMKEKDDAI